MRLGFSLILLFPLIMGSSCDQGIKFDPNFHIGDSLNGQIVNEQGQTLSCFEPQFDHFACMSEEKIKELRKILATARMPRNGQKEIQVNFLDKIDKILGKFKK